MFQAVMPESKTFVFDFLSLTAMYQIRAEHFVLTCHYEHFDAPDLITVHMFTLTIYHSLGLSLET